MLFAIKLLATVDRLLHGTRVKRTILCKTVLNAASEIPILETNAKNKLKASRENTLSKELGIEIFRMDLILEIIPDVRLFH